MHIFLFFESVHRLLFAYPPNLLSSRRQFVAVFDPHKTGGILQEVMIHVIRALRVSFFKIAP